MSLNTENSSPTELSILIPCFNEAKGITGTVTTVTNYVKKNFPAMSSEVILIDDGSKDQTPQIIKELADQESTLRPVYLPVNQGRGSAIKAGIKASTGRYLIMLDADLSYDAEHIGDIMNRFNADPKLDVVVVSPYMSGGKVANVPFKRLLVSRLANWILSGFFSSKLSTVTCVVRGYKGELLRGLPLLEEDKELHLEVLRKLFLLGARIEEIPGRLVWKLEKGQKRRATSLKLAGAAKKHLLYGLLNKPTRIFKFLFSFLFLIGLYESGAIMFSVYSRFQQTSEPFVRDLWQALYASFVGSPHTFVIAGVSLILSFQVFTFLALFEILRLQHEETLRHLLTILQKPFRSER